jgi:CubicO group peptidase (beta-lactamase class C family)
MMIKKFLSIGCLIGMFCVLIVSCTPSGVSFRPTATVSASAAAIIAKYRQAIPQLMTEQHIPGLAVAVAGENGTVWAEGFGYTDNNHKTAATPDTIFSVQSTSKTFTAVGVLLAVQDGLLDLDAPITIYLPDFTVHSISQEHPERKITLRMLLSLTVGFTHEAPVGNNFDLGPVSFDEHVKSISETWLRFPVGTGYAYSNLGISFTGYILQKVSGKPFAQYMHDRLLVPLGMRNSCFDMDKIRDNPNRAIGHTKAFQQVPLDIPCL